MEYRLILDRFEKSLTQEEAEKLLAKSIIQVDKGGNPTNLESSRELEYEVKFLSFFEELMSLYEFSVELLEPIKTCRHLLKRRCTYFSLKEKDSIRKLMTKCKSKSFIINGLDDIQIVIKLSCRDVYFLRFVSKEMVFEGSYEMAFPVLFLTENAYNKVANLSKNHDLYIRQIPS